MLLSSPVLSFSLRMSQAAGLAAPMVSAVLEIYVLFFFRQANDGLLHCDLLGLLYQLYEIKELIDANSRPDINSGPFICFICLEEIREWTTAGQLTIL